MNAPFTLAGIEIRVNDIIPRDAILVADQHWSPIGIMREEDGWTFHPFESENEAPAYSRWVISSALMCRFKDAV